MSFGSPEMMLFEMASSEVNAYFHGQHCEPAICNMHTLAKSPGPQAAAEKASTLTLGAGLGGREFFGAGALSLDEVFSPVQLLVDLELKDQAQRLVQGLDTECDVEACVEDVRAGISRGFTGLNRTLDGCSRLHWRPRLFNRQLLATWQAQGGPRLEDEARQLARELVAKHDWELGPKVRAELDRIYRRAEQELGAA